MALPARSFKHASAILFLFSLLSTSALALEFARVRKLWDYISDQTPLLSSKASARTCNVSVGFSLQSSYGSVAVTFQHPDGTLDTKVRQVEGDEAYLKAMNWFSLSSSQHLAPPYEDMGKYFMDLPRVKARGALKKIGLPATSEVGALGGVVKKLRSRVEQDFGIQVSNALLSTSHLLAFYEDDAEDIFEYAGIQYIRPGIDEHPPLWETSAAYAGHGLGLCEHFEDEARCNAENRDLPRNRIMAVHYSRTALTMSVPIVSMATLLHEPDFRRRENFSLGSDAISTYPSPELYWKEVKDTLLEILVSYPNLPRPQFIIVTGDSRVHGEFMSHLEDAMKSHLGYVPKIYAEDSSFVAARGTAELRRRTSYRKQFPWEDWSNLVGQCP